MKTLLAIQNVNIRLQRPHRDAPLKGQVFKGFEVNIDEEVVGENIDGIARWYRKGEEFYWGGGFSELITESQSIQDEIAEERMGDKQEGVDEKASVVDWGKQLFVNKPLPSWWDNTGKGIRVAVVDSGIFHMHPDLHDAVADESHGDFTTMPFSEARGEDQVGRGTGIAGIIGAKTRQSAVEGLIGVAPDAKIMDVQVMDGAMISKNGLNHALKILLNHGARGVDIIVLGAGLSGIPVRLDLIAELVSKGVIFVAPAGDATPGSSESMQGELFNYINFPAQLSLCISIGTINAHVKTQLESMSEMSFATGLDFLAAHRPVYSCNSPNSPGESYYKKHIGSPFAVAFVAGLIARILESCEEKKYRLSRVREELNKVAIHLDEMDFNSTLYQPLIKLDSNRLVN